MNLLVLPSLFFTFGSDEMILDAQEKSVNLETRDRSNIRVSAEY